MCTRPYRDRLLLKHCRHVNEKRNEIIASHTFAIGLVALLLSSVWPMLAQNRPKKSGYLFRPLLFGK